MQWKKGFTMVELLVVLIILAILVAVAAPMYFANVKRARVSEAVATMGTIRQALREYRVSHTDYYLVDAGDDTGVNPTAGIAAPPTTGVSVDVGVAQYFSNRAYSVALGTDGAFSSPAAVDFVITAEGDNSDGTSSCSATVSCAKLKSDVAGYTVKMDNSGTVRVRYTAAEAYQNY